MKEATGEANITVITIVLIAIVLAVGTVVVNSVLKNAKKSSCCNTIGGIWKNGKCYTPAALCEAANFQSGTGCWAVTMDKNVNHQASQKFRQCLGLE